MNVLYIFIFLFFSYIEPSHSWILRKCYFTSNYFLPSRGVHPLLAKRKAGRVLITLECSVSRKLGFPPSRYYTTKNKVNTPNRLELMKYNKYLKKHTLHKEIR
ncbi:50S ribosomal protein L33 [Theileria orientalis strain Shintoku]|uniref:50S ribosomal protein L33 n=1 Tax=Theileria orientalis strain Shintoku TaxID=869250 RepID=J7M835_THEOR|nr:50S ribosomal protein L33 [Theileria orientalis strain Shintoku]PVC50313.1 50S ribosomal protein L33 [Theileria orientalis]BAM38593.1 50S ribosomal protein L33 [Theileria orientalis strain Shintoku]|eukprot:XP_009688894.1 50S ribosomal protein L33 [Theileria orientalis strain Shintoku]